MNELLAKLATITPLAWVGMASVAAGEIMMSNKRVEGRSWRFWAFVMYIPWDLIYMYEAIRIHSMAFLLAQIFFTYMTALGMWNNRPGVIGVKQ